MAITVQNILQRAAIQLVDEQNVRWTQNELLAWLNDAQRSIARYIPEVGVEVDSSLAALATARQSLPSDCIVLIDVISHNSGSAVRSLRRGDSKTLNALFPSWLSDTDTGTGQPGTWTYDERVPKQYWLHPAPADGLGTVEVIYRRAPANVSASDSIGIDDIYGDSLLDYILYRSYMKEEEEVALDQTKAVFHYTAYLQGLGQKLQGDAISAARSETL